MRLISRLSSRATALLGLALSLSASDGVYQDQGGIVAIEIEDLTPIPSWNSYTTFAGFTGSAYFRWDGPDFFNQPGNGVIAYEFQVETSATWRLSIHNRHNDPAPDQDNDVWVRMDGGSWQKVYSNLGTSTVNVWNWHTRFDNGDNPHTDATYQLSEGEHRIEFSGRSNGWMMDRFHLYLPGHPDATNEDLTPSTCAAPPLSYCTAKISSSGCESIVVSNPLSEQPVSGAGDYRARLTRADGNRTGVLFTSLSGPAAIPFQGGTLCMNAPIKRSDVLFTAGTSGACNGTFNRIINDGSPLSTGLGFDAGPGGTSYVQAWYRDPSAVDGTGIALSNAIQFDWQ